MMRTLALLVAILIPATLEAQTAGISPKAAIAAGPTNRGVSGLGHGFGLDAHRLQQVYNFDSFTSGTTQVLAIRSIRFRMPAAYNTGTQGGQTVVIAMDLALAATGVDADTLTTTFASNVDASTQKRVFSTKKLVLPILGSTTTPSTGFDFKIPLDSAIFVYNPSAKRALVLDLHNKSYKQSTWTYYVDGWTRSRSGISGKTEVSILTSLNMPSSDFGTSTQNGTYAGCNSSASQLITHDADPLTLIPASPDNVFSGSTGVAGLPGALSMGAKAINATFPGTSCTVVNDLLLIFPMVSDKTGTAALPLPILDDRNLVGISFYTQMFWLDPKANRLGITSSRGLLNKIGNGMPLTGSIAKQRGLITEFSN